MHTIPHGRPAFRSSPGRRPTAEVFGNGPGDFVRRLLETVLTWQERATQRYALATLDDRMLKDIGLSRADVFLEARKPFWRA